MDIDRLKELLSYNTKTGWFVWRQSRGRAKAGDRAGRVHASGYREIRVDGRLYMEHLLAWFYVFGRFPDDELDHRDRQRANNALSNLRPATSSQNKMNRPGRSACGHKGVSWHRQNGLWRARLGKKTLGYFKDVEDAAEAYNKAAVELHGDFARAS